MMPETRLDDINLKGDESPRKDTLPGTYDEAPRQKRVCGCLSPMAANLLLLFWFCVAVGCSIAPMTATYRGWGYYSTDNFYFKPDVVPPQLVGLLPYLATPAQVTAYKTQYAVEGKGFFFEFWVGWMKGTSTLRKWPQLSFLQCRNIDFVSIQAKLGALGGVAVTTLKSACLNEYRYLKEEDMAGQVWGAFTCALLGLGALSAFIFAICTLIGMFSKKNGSCGSCMVRRTWWISLLWGVVTLVMVIGMYMFLAIGVHRETVRLLQWGCTPWPDWAFYVGVVAAVGWFGAAFVQRSFPAISGHVRAKPTGAMPMV